MRVTPGPPVSTRRRGTPQAAPRPMISTSGDPVDALRKQIAASAEDSVGHTELRSGSIWSRLVLAVKRILSGHLAKQTTASEFQDNKGPLAGSGPQRGDRDD